MKKKFVVLAVVAALIVAAAAFLLMSNRNASLNASYEQAAGQLTAAGYTVSTLTDADSLSTYNASGLTAVVIAYKGTEKLEQPDEDAMAEYNMVELFYFETEEHAKAYYLTDDFQLGYQAWSDAFYHIGIKNFNYNYTGSIAYAGTQAAIDLCA